MLMNMTDPKCRYYKKAEESIDHLITDAIL